MELLRSIKWKTEFQAGGPVSTEAYDDGNTVVGSCKQLMVNRWGGRSVRVWDQVGAEAAGDEAGKRLQWD